MGSSESLRRVRRFDDLLLETIDDVLKRIFGGEPAEIIFRHMEKRHSLKRVEILERANDFDDSLQEILGSSTDLIENLILKSLYSKLELKFEAREGYEFSDYIKELMRSVDVEGRRS